LNIRIKFEKTGNLKFIGHLDVMRTFQKINRRAGINIQYSQGFSPHQEMSFATPLGVGLTSKAEYVDFKMNEVPSKKEFIQMINAASVPELQVVDACLLPDEKQNAMSLMVAADYELSFREGHEPENTEDWFEKFFGFYNQETIPVEKQTKKNTLEVDLKKQIRILERRENSIFMQVDTGSASNLKPDFVIRTFCESIGQEYDPFQFEICRTELYGEVDGQLRRLIDYGTDF